MQYFKILLLLAFITAFSADANAQKRGRNNVQPPCLKSGALQFSLSGEYNKHAQAYGPLPAPQKPPYTQEGIVQNGLSASVGYFVSKNIMLGVSAHQAWEMRSPDTPVLDSITVSHFSTGLLARVYLPFHKRFAMYTDIEYGYVGNASTQKHYNGYDPNPIFNGTLYADINSFTSGLGGSVSGGFLFLISKKIGIDLAMRYHFADTKGSTTVKYIQYNDNRFFPSYLNRSGIGARLGVQFFLFK